ncbi:MAG: penicillin-binding protein 2 [Candidatus Dojkabacteria bacterium]|nr:penicillin-binding protein 2 [Candidatus Dojkabacteria bacterium]
MKRAGTTEKTKPKHAVRGTYSWQDISCLEGQMVGRSESKTETVWRTLYLYIAVAIVFAYLTIGAVNLQLVNGRENVLRSERNRLEEQLVHPDRGVIYDRNGEKLAINVPSFNIVLDPGSADEQEIDKSLNLVAGLLNRDPAELTGRYEEAVAEEPLIRQVLLVSDASRDEVLSIRSHEDDLKGISIEYTSKRQYIGGDMFSHLLGYTGEASVEQIENNQDLIPGDTVGKDGIEFFYDDLLRGTKGVKVIELDAGMNVVNEYLNEGTAPVAGDSLYLSIDAQAQKKMFEILTGGIEKYKATGAAAVLEDVQTGELLVSASAPSFDNNLFVGGISAENYAALTADTEGLPLFNRVISAQVPPGSMFKTIVASAALQEGAVTRNTVFNSTGVIYLGNGTYPFQEYHQHAYGPLDLIGGIAKSSNIYFCYTMIELGIDAFVPYAEFFGIGSPSGLDIPGEMTGRVPSPENKLALAETSPWLDPIWYPEGDSCNSAIGQGITTVTPIQVANWMAAIANGGKVMKPHLTHSWVSASAESGQNGSVVEPVVVREGKVSDENLAIVREGMRNSASGPLSVIVPFRSTKIPVAGKTGTAEFGVKDERGYYTKTHAWVSGFFPYDNPKYSFVVFLEGGGESNNAAQLAADFINWWADNR